MGVNDNNVYSFLFSCGGHVSAWHICQAGCVITKTGNDYKQPQPTKNHHKSPANDHKPLENDHKPPANAYKLPANDQQLPVNDQKRSPLHIKPKS